MKQMKIDIADELLDAYKEYARHRGISLHEVIQHVLARGVSAARPGWLEECFRVMDKAGANSAGKHWRREDLYDA